MFLGWDLPSFQQLEDQVKRRKNICQYRVPPGAHYLQFEAPEIPLVVFYQNVPIHTPVVVPLSFIVTINA